MFSCKLSRLFLLTALVTFVGKVNSKSQYVMPMSMGMKMSIPYDVANIFIRPIGGAIGVAVSIGLLLIIFFGVITSPFGYFFGIPSRKYVLGTAEASPRYFSEGSHDRIQELLYPSSLPFFNFMTPDELENEDCQQLALCYAHGALQYLPKPLIGFYGLFSGQLTALPAKLKRAIIQGLGSSESCGECYSACPHSGFSLIVKTLLALLPDSVKNDNFRKRKQAMYM